MNPYFKLQILGIFIVIILYLLINHTKQPRIEGFENHNEYTVEFPDPSVTKPIIASRLYISAFKDLDYSVRDCPPSVELTQQKYCRNIIKLTDLEKKNFRKFYQEIVKKIPNDQRSKFLEPNIKIVKVNGLENGYPHTHQDLIIFDQSYFNQLNGFSGLDGYYNQASTLIHEITHVKQRKSPTKYDNIYRNWGFKPISYQYLKNNMSEYLLERIRLNPDELPYYRFWVWNDHFIPLVLYESRHARKLSNVLYQGVLWNSLGKEENLSYDLTRFSDYLDYFGVNKNHYHPIEILAEYQAIHFLNILNGVNEENEENEGYQIYLRLFKN